MAKLTKEQKKMAGRSPTWIRDIASTKGRKTRKHRPDAADRFISANAKKKS
jgi:hypothetical protein